MGFDVQLSLQGNSVFHLDENEIRSNLGDGSVESGHYGMWTLLADTAGSDRSSPEQRVLDMLLPRRQRFADLIKTRGYQLSVTITDYSDSGFQVDFSPSTLMLLRDFGAKLQVISDPRSDRDV